MNSGDACRFGHTATLQTDFSLCPFSKWVTPVTKEESTASSYTLTKEKQEGQKEQKEPPEFGKESETQSHTRVKET